MKDFNEKAVRCSMEEESKMMTLIIGGSGSGKSAYAEKSADSLSQTKDQKYYLATMQVLEDDKEGHRKVERHRQLRRGKGFITIEQPVDIDQAVEKMDRIQMSGTRTALLECIANLTANEMFAGEIPRSSEQVSAKIIEEIGRLRQNVTHLVIVSSNVFEDGTAYDKTTMEYIQAMGTINQRLAVMADRVVEVVVGIPVLICGS